MISKIIKGANAAGLLRYCFAESDAAQRSRTSVVDLGGTIPGASVGEITRQFSLLTAGRPLLRKNCAHLILRWTKDDNPSVLDQQRMAQCHAERLGFRHWRAVSHGNHIHIVASRVNADATVVTDSDDYRRGEASRADLEREFGLTRVPASHLRDRARVKEHVRSATQAEMAIAMRAVGSVRLQLQEAVSASVQGGATFTEFVQRLGALGVQVKLNASAAHKVAGITFSLDGVEMPGSALGRSFSWAQLQGKGLDYDFARDSESIIECVRGRATEHSAAHGEGDSRQDRGHEGGAGANCGTDTAAGGIDGRAVGAGAGVASSTSRYYSYASSDLRQQGKGGHGKGGEVDYFSVPHNGGGSRPSAQRGELCEGYRQAPAPQHVDSGNHGRHPVRSAVNSTVLGDRAGHRQSSSSAGESTAGPLEVLDGSETGEEALRKWSRNMARMARLKEQRQNPPTSPLPAYSNIRWIANLAGVELSRDPTTQQVLRQIRAFACERVEIGVLPPKHRTDLPPKRPQIMPASRLAEPKVLSWLKLMNRNDYDVYVRPAPRDDGLVEPLILVDDLTATNAHDMKSAGFPCSVLVESSPGNFQAWVRVSEQPISKALARCAARLLADRFDADTAAASYRQFGRLGGFTNRKMKHRNADNLAPFARLRVCQSVLAPGGRHLLTHASELIAGQTRENAAVRVPRVPAADASGIQRVDAVVSAFSAKRARVRVFRSDGTLDDSAADFGAATAMLQEGWPVAIVRQTLRQSSPDLERRHRDVDAYLDRTMAAAVGAIKPAVKPFPRPKPKFRK